MYLSIYYPKEEKFQVLLDKMNGETVTSSEIQWQCDLYRFFLFSQWHWNSYSLAAFFYISLIFIQKFDQTPCFFNFMSMKVLTWTVFSLVLSTTVDCLGVVVVFTTEKVTRLKVVLMLFEALVLQTMQGSWRLENVYIYQHMYTSLGLEVTITLWRILPYFPVTKALQLEE